MAGAVWVSVIGIERRFAFSMGRKAAGWMRCAGVERCGGVKLYFWAALLFFYDKGLRPFDPNHGMHPLIIPEGGKCGVESLGRGKEDWSIMKICRWLMCLALCAICLMAEVSFCTPKSPTFLHFKITHP